MAHQRLLHKLKQYGINGPIHKWLENFLTKRRQRVVIGGENSHWVDVKSGVPQGTVVGPLLFLVYLNDMPNNIKSSIRLFADDCVVYREIKNKDDATTLQNDLKALDAWQHTWQMSFNTDKCFLLRVTHKKKPILKEYTLGGSILKQTQSHSYLGVEITSDLKWNSHISNITAKANRSLGFIRRNLYSCPSHLKTNAYSSLVRPLLEYSSTAQYGTHTLRSKSKR